MSSPYIEVPKQKDLKSTTPSKFSWLTWAIQNSYEKSDISSNKINNPILINTIKEIEEKSDQSENSEEDNNSKENSSGTDINENSSEEIFQMSEDETCKNTEKTLSDVDSDSDEEDSVESLNNDFDDDDFKLDNNSVCEDLKYFTHNFSLHLYNDFVNLPDVVHFYLGFFGSMFLGYGEEFITALIFTAIYKTFENNQEIKKLKNTPRVNDIFLGSHKIFKNKVRSRSNSF